MTNLYSVVQVQNLNETLSCFFLFYLRYDWFPRYHLQTQLLRLVAIVGILQQSLIQF